jgi:hypothetical protein
VVVLFYRCQRWPHDVLGGGRGGDVGLLGHLFYLYLCWDLGLGAGPWVGRFAPTRMSVSTLFARVLNHLVRVGPVLALTSSTGQGR